MIANRTGHANLLRQRDLQTLHAFPSPESNAIVQRRDSLCPQARGGGTGWRLNDGDCGRWARTVTLSLRPLRNSVACDRNFQFLFLSPQPTSQVTTVLLYFHKIVWFQTSEGQAGQSPTPSRRTSKLVLKQFCCSHLSQVMWSLINMCKIPQQSKSYFMDFESLHWATITLTHGPCETCSETGVGLCWGLVRRNACFNLSCPQGSKSE